MEKMVPGDIEMGELGLPQPDDETAPLHQGEVVKRLKEIQFRPRNTEEMTNESLEIAPWTCCEIILLILNNLLMIIILPLVPFYLCSLFYIVKPNE